MEREEILKMAQNSDGRGNEVEIEIARKSGIVDVLAAIVVVLVLVISEYCIKKTFNLGVVSIAFTIVSADCLYMGIKNKKVWRIICGIIAGIIALFVIVAFFDQLRTV